MLTRLTSSRGKKNYDKYIHTSGVVFHQITFTGKKDPVEDVFLTHLEMDFPEVRPIAASVRGK